MKEIGGWFCVVFVVWRSNATSPQFFAQINATMKFRPQFLGPLLF